MGGGASLMEGLEEMVATTYLIGRAISAISFPGMYRIYDFHSKKAPILKNARQFTFFAPDSDDEASDEEDANAPDPADYAHFFKVKVGTDTIYLETPLEANEAGWTPLHSCCMSFNTVDAGRALIDEIVRSGESLEIKTKQGPGTFNSGWTPLHMASAYGIEPLVDALVEAGANVNTTNSFGYSCLLEACHRGFEGIVKSLIKGASAAAATKGGGGEIDFAYIPCEEDAARSPFSGAPSQAALGEAARCGFYKVVKILLDAGAPKDLPNSLGWTALHEACFYNRIETVKTLLLAGANATLRTRLGALPYHLAGVNEIKTMLESMGGDAAVPSEGDTIDMVKILTELTMPEMVASSSSLSNGGSRRNSNGGGGGQQILILGGGGGDGGGFTFRTVEFPARGAAAAAAAQQQQLDGEDENDPDSKFFTETRRLGDAKPTNSTKKDAKLTATTTGEDGDGDELNAVTTPEKAAYLHSGPVLGNLPSLTPAAAGGNAHGHGRGPGNTSPSSAIHRDLDVALALDSSSGGRGGGLFNVPAGMSAAGLSAGGGRVSRKADDKRAKKNKKRAAAADEVPKDMPRAYLCQLTQRPMSEPVKTTYGNIYDRSAIVSWLSKQGKICPLTGAPLSEVDLTPIPDLGEEIREWILQRSKASTTTTANGDSGGAAAGEFGIGGARGGNSSGSPTSSSASGMRRVVAGAGGAGVATGEDESLYDF